MNALKDLLAEFKPLVVHHYTAGFALEYAEDQPFTVAQVRQLEAAFLDHELVEKAAFSLDGRGVGLAVQYNARGKRDQRGKETFSELIKPQFSCVATVSATILRRQRQTITKLEIRLPVDTPAPNLPELRELSPDVLVSRYEAGILTVSLSVTDRDKVKAVAESISGHLNAHISSFRFDDPDPDAALFPAETDG